MPLELKYAVVDAFTGTPYNGNPAAVVLDASSLSEAQMLSIASEFNLSETAFVLPSDSAGAAVRLRWFTPELEVAMCGHATIAAVHALVETGRFAEIAADSRALLPIQTASGILRAQIERIATQGEEQLVWLELPRPVLSASPLNLTKVATLLGTTLDALDESLPVMRTQDDDVLVFLKELATLQSLQPNFQELSTYSNRQRIRGWCVATLATLSPSIHVQSRFFAPAAGIDEDPVTGSVHGPLATYLVVNELIPVRNGVSAVSCVQSASTGRAGLVRALVEIMPGQGFKVRIAGQCVTTMRGKLTAVDM